MDNNKSSKSALNIFIPFLVAYLGSKGIFYYFSFKHSLFSEEFDIQKTLISFGVFLVLFCLGSILVKHVINNKKKPKQ